MIHVYKTCEHCGVTYIYQVSGCGCDRPDNDDRYCPDCMAAINEALNRLPKRIEPRFKEIECTDELISKLSEIKKKSEEMERKRKEDLGGIDFPKICEMYHDEYDNVETYYDSDGFRYMVKWNDENDKKYFEEFEYDLIKKEFTNHPYINYSQRTITKDFYSMSHPSKPWSFIATEFVPAEPLAPPRGMLTYMSESLGRLFDDSVK